MRYRISKNIIFLSSQASSKLKLPKTFNNHVILSDKSTHREFIINPTTKIFIQKFSTPKTFSEITSEIANEVNAATEVVKKLIEPFFNHVKYRKFIVPENSGEEKIKRRQLFNANKIFDDFRIVKNIDVTHDIDIYLAIDLTSGKEVVIKLLKQIKKKEVDQLNKEFNVLTFLNTTGVTPRAYKFITNQHYAYFVQDYIDGLRLPVYMDVNKGFTLNDILSLSREMITGFKRIHAKGIIHGDIHPSNIIVTKDNKTKIIDFGLAIDLQAEKDEVVNFGGVYYFMPPERINTTTYKKFKKKPDFFSDVYQLGILLYILLYDKYPFNGIIWEELSKEIKEKEIIFPAKSSYNFTVPIWLTSIIQKCLAKNPAKRFADAQKLYLSFSKHATEQWQ